MEYMTDEVFKQACWDMYMLEVELYEMLDYDVNDQLKDAEIIVEGIFSAFLKLISKRQLNNATNSYCGDEQLKISKPSLNSIINDFSILVHCNLSKFYFTSIISNIFWPLENLNFKKPLNDKPFYYMKIHCKNLLIIL